MVRSKRHLKSTLEGGRQEEGLGKLRRHSGVDFLGVDDGPKNKSGRGTGEAGIRRFTSVWNGKGAERRYVCGMLCKKRRNVSSCR